MFVSFFLFSSYAIIYPIFFFSSFTMACLHFLKRLFVRIYRFVLFSPRSKYGLQKNLGEFMGLYTIFYPYTMCWNSFIRLSSNESVLTCVMNYELKCDYLDIGMLYYSKVAKSIPWIVISC